MPTIENRGQGSCKKSWKSFGKRGNKYGPSIATANLQSLPQFRDAKLCGSKIKYEQAQPALFLLQAREKNVTLETNMGLSALTYILGRILGAVGRFFAHWYTKGSALYWHSVLDFFEELERMVSLRVTIANWYRPLYGDYTRFGMIFGIPVRLVRVMLSAALYAFLFAFFAAAYAGYLALPIFLLSRLT